MGLAIEPKPSAFPVEPFPDLLWAWNGFWRLSNTRPMGFDGVLRIPLTEIEAYARLHDFGLPQKQELLTYIERMDTAFMEYIAKKREEEERKRKSKERPPRRR